MRSPPKPIPSYGASRSTGGFLRGRAAKNAFNMADADDEWQDRAPHTVDRPFDPGSIQLFYSDDSPQNFSLKNTTPIWRIPVTNIDQCSTVKAVIQRATAIYQSLQST